MSLHVKKINRQFSVLKKARVIGLFSCTTVPGETQIVNDCPVMSGFFHALLDALEESLNDVLDSIPTVVIAQLCRAFFMHNCINFGINNGVNKNHLIFVLLMSVFYYSSFSFTFE